MLSLGSHCGDLALLGSSKRLSNAIAREHTECLVLRTRGGNFGGLELVNVSLVKKGKSPLFWPHKWIRSMVTDQLLSLVILEGEGGELEN